MPFLPITLEEMHEYGWSQPDFVYVTGDAYIDHPSFGPAIITRVLENFGYTCAIISQPDINKDSDFTLFGSPFTPTVVFVTTLTSVSLIVNFEVDFSVVAVFFISQTCKITL